MADFEQVYATLPGKCPRFRPSIEEILIIDPPFLAARMRKQTYFDTSHVPVAFVFIVLFHSSSDKSSDDFTVPEIQIVQRVPNMSSNVY